MRRAFVDPEAQNKSLQKLGYMKQGNKDFCEFPNLIGGRCLVLIMRNGKVNKFHKVDALRNKDPLLCPLSALAFYFMGLSYVATDPTAKLPVPTPSHRRTDE